jgi:hypothetical protein
MIKVLYKMVKYADAKIFKVVSKVTDEAYITTSCLPLRQAEKKIKKRRIFGDDDCRLHTARSSHVIANRNLLFNNCLPICKNQKNSHRISRDALSIEAKHVFPRHLRKALDNFSSKRTGATMGTKITLHLRKN